MKEFLTRHGVPFVSINVIEDQAAFEELARLGARSVPICQKGDEWANGQVLRDVARVAGIAYGAPTMLSPAALVERTRLIQEAAQRYLLQFPEDTLDRMLPNRPRSYRTLFYHIFNIADCWLEHEVDDLPLIEGVYGRTPPPRLATREDLHAYGVGVMERFDVWWKQAGPTTAFDATADVYYGDQTKHDFLERTTWHAGQHVRQVMLILEEHLHIAPDRPLPPATFDGLPMPEKPWDDEKPFAPVDNSAPA